MSLSLPDRQAFDPGNDPVPAKVSAREGEGEVVALAADGAAGSAEWARATAVALARARIRRAARLLLMDLELDTPELHELLGVENREGTSDVFLFGSSIQRVARAVDGGSFYLSSAGTATSDPEAVLDHPRWKGLVRGFRDAEATLLLYVRLDLPGSAAVLRRADRIIVLGDPEPAALQGFEDAIVAVLEPPASGAPRSGEAEGEPAEGAEVRRAGEAIVDIAELAPDPPSSAAVPDDAPGAGASAASGPGSGADEEVVDIAELAPDPAGETTREGIVDIEALAPDPGADPAAPGPGAAAAGEPAGTGAVPGDAAPEPDAGPDAFERPGPGGLEAGEESGEEAGEEVGELEVTASFEGPGEEPEGPASERGDAGETGEEEIPDFGADLVTGPDFGGGAPDRTSPGAGAEATDPESAEPAEAPAPEGPTAGGAGLDEGVEEAGPPEPVESVPGSGDEKPEPAADERDPATEEAERRRRLEEQLRARQSPRWKGRVALLFVLLLLVAGAAFGVHWYGYVRVPGLDGALAALLGPARTGPAPSLVTEGMPPESPVLGHSLVVDEYRTPGAANEVATALGQRLPDHLFVVAPVPQDSDVAYRLLAGPARGADEAEALRASLAGVLTREDSAEWEVAPTPFAFLLEEVGTLETARERVAAFTARGVPAYTLRVSYPDGDDRFRVYAGAYENEQDARAMQGILAREGIDDAAFTERRGGLPE